MDTPRKILVQGLFVLALIAGLMGPAAFTAQAVRYNLHPSLLQMAAAAPQSLVSVIVQKADTTQAAEQQALSLGATVTDELRIINAFTAQMTAQAAGQLSTSPAVRWISLDAPVVTSACSGCVDTTNLVNTYILATRADQVWNNAPYRQGQGIGVAIIDSGINPNSDFYTVMGVNRLVGNARFNTDYNQTVYDNYGHGTHVASIVGGNGQSSGGKYIGVAPMVNLINVKVSNDDGSSSVQSVVQGLQWVLENKKAYNIRVVNLSMNSSVSGSYNTDPLDAAVEILWFNGIVVVVSAGNSGTGTLYPPANDPFVITVGATDDKGTATLADDRIASFSAYGVTESGAAKPELVAPGKNITARLINTNSGLAAAHPGNKLIDQYFRMSGTSMAAPMVSGAVALLLQDEPGLNPDQVKYRLKATANKSWPGYDAAKAGAGALDVYAAVYGTTTKMANTGTSVSNLLTTGPNGVLGPSVGWSSVSWSSVSWSSVSWSSVSWSSVSWSSVSWSSDYWGP